MEIGSNIFLNQMSAYMQKVDESGILSKFLSCFGYDWETFIKPLIEEQTDIHNPEKSKDLLGEIMGLPDSYLDVSNTKFLTLIGKGLGSPIDVTEMPAGSDSFIQPGPDNYPILYRKLLIFTISLYKWRGTALALKYWGYLIGMDLDVVVLTTPDIKYDVGISYDSKIQTSEITEITPTYDRGICEQCSQFYIRVNNAIYSGR